MNAASIREMILLADDNFLLQEVLEHWFADIEHFARAGVAPKYEQLLAKALQEWDI